MHRSITSIRFRMSARELAEALAPTPPDGDYDWSDDIPCDEGPEVYTGHDADDTALALQGMAHEPMRGAA